MQPIIFYENMKLNQLFLPTWFLLPRITLFSYRLQKENDGQHHEEENRVQNDLGLSDASLPRNKDVVDEHNSFKKPNKDEIPIDR